jgi:hypothetical protein
MNETHSACPCLRCPAASAEVRRRIAKLRAEGQSLQAIADTLTAEGVPRARGGRWHPRTIR